MNKLWLACVLASAVLFLASISLFIYAEVADPHVVITDSSIYCPHLAIGSFNVTAIKDCGGSIIFFNQNVPYLGSVIGLAGDKSVTERGLTGLGFYFRLIGHTDK